MSVKGPEVLQLSAEQLINEHGLDSPFASFLEARRTAEYILEASMGPDSVIPGAWQTAAYEKALVPPADDPSVGSDRHLVAQLARAEFRGLLNHSGGFEKGLSPRLVSFVGTSVLRGVPGVFADDPDSSLKTMEQLLRIQEAATRTQENGVVRLFHDEHLSWEEVGLPGPSGVVLYGGGVSLGVYGESPSSNSWAVREGDVNKAFSALEQLESHRIDLRDVPEFIAGLLASNSSRS